MLAEGNERSAFFVEQNKRGTPVGVGPFGGGLGITPGGGFAGIGARPPAVDPVPFLLRAERDLPQSLFSEPVSVRKVAALPERLFRLFPGLRHRLLPSRHSTRVSKHET